MVSNDRMDGYFKFLNEYKANSEEIGTIENKDYKNKTSSTKNIFITTQVNKTDDTTSHKDEEDKEEIEIDCIEIPGDIPPSQDSDEGNAIDHVFMINSNQPKQEIIKEDEEKPENISNNKENQKGINPSSNCSQNLTASQVVLISIREKSIKYLLCEFMARTIILSVLNVLKAINRMAIEKLGFIYDFFEIATESLKLIQDETNILTYQDKTLFDFLVNIFKVQKEDIKLFLLKEEINSQYKTKILNSLFSSKIFEIHSIYLDASPNAYFQNFKKQFPEFNNEILEINEKIVKILKKNFHEKDKSSAADFNFESTTKSLTKALDKIQIVIENMILKKNQYENINNNELKIDDFMRRKLITGCSKSLSDFLINKCKKYNNKAIPKLTIKEQLGNSFHDFRSFMNKKISKIYEDFKPKKLKKSQKKYYYAIKQIEEAIKKEEKENGLLFKIYNYAYFIDFFYAFLEDKDYIIIENEENKNKTFEILKIVGFKTYKDFFDDNKEEKEKMKKDMKGILLEEIGRAKRIKNKEN